METMERKEKVSRRKLLMGTLGSVGILAGSTTLARAFGKLCGLTPPQVEGPFYPIEDQPDKDTDLTRIAGSVFRAKGQIIYIRGSVTDSDCRPVEGALVEIWQACASGRYDHPGDRNNQAPLDLNFQYWGQALTDAGGRYMFETILPGAYEAAPGWIRPPHIHYKVQKRGFLELTTQLYFHGNEFNAGDRILNRLPPRERAKVIVKLKDSPENAGEGMEPSAKYGRFDIVLQAA